MLISEVWRVLTDAGVEMVPVDSQHVELRHGRRRVRMVLCASARPLRPGAVVAMAGRQAGPGLLVLPAATAESRRAAERAGWSWLVLEPGRESGVLRLGNERVQLGRPDPDQDRPRGTPGRVPWGWLTLVRHLLGQPPATQRVLADWTHVSQPRVSQILTALAGRRLVRRTGAGWMVRDFDQLLREWLDRYPGHGGISTHWYGLDSPRQQAQAAIHRLATDPGVRERCSTAPFAVLSGDLAADIIAPWRSPARAVVYARTGVDLAEAGLTPAGEEEATLELIVPADPGVWPLASTQFAPSADSSMPVADPLQVLWDVQRAPGPDSGEAAAKLWERLREHHVAVQPTIAA
jgi:hypothetical protein